MDLQIPHCFDSIEILLLSHTPLLPLPLLQSHWLQIAFQQWILLLQRT